MSVYLKSICLTLLIASVITYIYHWKSLTDETYHLYDIKYWLLLLIFISLTWSLFISHKINDSYVFPFLLFLNLAILPIIDTYDPNPSLLHWISMFGILCLLLFYSYEDVQLNRGLVNNIHPQKIYLHVLVLAFWYLTLSSWVASPLSKISCFLVLLYPLFFPLEEFFIHRIYSLFFMILIYFMFLKTIH